MSEVEILETAVKMTNDRIEKIPEYGLYSNVKNQLTYLLDFLGKENDGGDLGKINLGHIAVHEFEETDPEYSKFLKRSQNIAFKYE